MKKSYLIIAGVVLASLITISTIIFINNKKFLVTFDSNGGTSVESIKVKKEGLIKQPTDPIKNGYIFIGWTESGKAFSFLTKVTKNITLTAAWEEAKENVEICRIKFDSAGGSAILDQIVEKGKLVKRPEDPIKDNYEFAGWTLNDVDYDFTSVANSDITIKAKWKEIKKTEDKKVSSNKGTQTTTTNNISVILPIPGLTVQGYGGDPEISGVVYKITSIDSADGIEVYKATSENNYLLEKTLTKAELAQTNFEIQITAKIGEHNHYKIRAYKMIDGVKKYSDYSSALEVNGHALSIPGLTVQGYGGDPEISGVIYKISTIDFADGIEVYKATSENNYLLEKTLTKAELAQTNFEIQITAEIGEHNHYKIRAYKMVDGVKKYSDYSSALEVNGPALSIPGLTVQGYGGDPEISGVVYKITSIDFADGIEVYKATSENNYLLEKTLTKAELAQTNFEIQITANAGEHNYYKMRAYKTVDGVKKYSDYSRVVDVSH